MKKYSVALAALFLFISSPTLVHAKKNQTQKNVPAFEKIKSLAGSWTAETEKDGKKETARVIYKITSGGSAVEETLFPGTPKEMISVYHLDGSKVMMTHYCMLGNQPRLVTTTSSKGKKINFEFLDATGMRSPQDPHMGALTLSFKGKNHMNQEWTMFTADGEKQSMVFHYVREK